MLLDRFLLLFETDADQAASSVSNLNNQLDSTAHEAESASLSVGHFIGALAALAVVKSTVINAAFRTDEVGKFAETFGFAIDKVDAWGEAVSRNGGSAESFRNSIASLNEKMADFNLTGGGPAAEVFKNLGINAKDSEGKMKGMFDLLPELADRFENLSREESFGLGKRLGLDQGTILTLQQGRVAVQNLVEQQRQLGAMTDESYKTAAEFNDEMDNSGRALESLSIIIGNKVLPYVKSFLKWLTKVFVWMKNHQEFMVGFFVAIAGAVLYKTVPALLALNKAILANPIVRLIAGVLLLGAAFGALYEDIKAYQAGHDSFIGKFFEKYPSAETAVKNLGLAFTRLQEDFRKLATLVHDGIDWVSAFNIDEAILDMKNKFNDLWEYIKSLFDFSKLTDTLTDNLPEILGGKPKDKSSYTTDENILPDFDDNGVIIQNTIKAIETQEAYAANPVNTSTPRAGFGNINQRKNINVTVGDIKIDASGMSQEDAQGLLSDEILRQIGSSVGELDDGVAY